MRRGYLEPALQIESVRVESVVTLTGRLVPRTAETINPKLATGEIELRIEAYQLQAAAEMLPLQVNSDEDAGEDLRLTYASSICGASASTATSCCAPG
jgi:Aspartyl-tRNA synthetase